MKKRVITKAIIFHAIILFIMLLAIIERHIYENFGIIDLKQVFYNIEIPIGKASGNFFNKGVDYVLPRYFLLLFFYSIILYIFYKLEINISFRNFKKINLNNILKKLRWLIVTLVCIGNIFLLNKYFQLFDSIKNQFSTTEIYEKYYVDPSKVNITMPEYKRNLVYIYVESLETSELSINNGGYREKSIIPEIEKLAQNNINFSNTDKLGGFYPAYGTTYTVAAIIGQTSGLPLIPSGKKDGNSQNLTDEVLTKAYSLGEILKNHGYKNYFMFGSDKNFADRSGYLEGHGEYEIFDFQSAKDNQYISNDYSVDWWGFEDKKLYEYAKIKLSEISKNDEPFNFSLLTVDTHPYGGYLDETCNVDDSLTGYENVYKCASKMLSDFIKWLQKQTFYKNTTVIITGDHLNMVIDGIHEKLPADYERTGFNIFMNSAVKTKCTNNRIFTTFDMYPTTLSAMGAIIEDERLGFGTNLFSCKETLAEEISLNYFQQELEKNSSYYKLCLLHGLCNKQS